ncbi:MAG: methionine synthase [Armatimonadota bacterium]
MNKTAIGGALGNCVHVAGVINFLRLTELEGYETKFLGPACETSKFVDAIKENDPEIVGVSYRLSPEVAEKVISDFVDTIKRFGLDNRRYIFGGTPPVCEVAEKFDFFEACFNGHEEMEDVLCVIRGEDICQEEEDFGSTQLERLERKRPSPLLRHHFGLPSMQETIEGIKKIADAKVVDVISIAPDQNAQEFFFNPELMRPELDGAGGCPIRTEKDLLDIYEASRRGNYPLLRIYSGTRELIKWAELALRTINNAWGAIPLFWYSELDGRSKRPITEAIKENQEAMRFYAEHKVPVEVNDSHHWSLRDAHDAVAVAAAYLAAYNAKSVGVNYYIAQYMFNTPPSTYGSMDLAKMLAKAELIESLHDDNFTTMRQVRAGLLSLSPDMDIAQGQLAASAALAMGMKPHIIHVVSFTEADHAATADDVIESCKIVKGVLRNCLFGFCDLSADEKVIRRKEQLVEEAKVIIDSIKMIGSESADPLSDPDVLSKSLKVGILDAPQLAGNPAVAGRVKTACIDGAVYAVDIENGKILSERDRILSLPSNID